MPRPTATHIAPFHATPHPPNGRLPFPATNILDDASTPVQVIPSELVQIVDGPPPVATKYEPFHAIPRALLVGLFRTGYQLDES